MKISADNTGKLILAAEKGQYLFLLRLKPGKTLEMQTYTGMLVIK